MFDIKKALEYYEIDEPDYYERCKTAEKEIINSEEYSKVFDKFSSILFGFSHEERAEYHTTDNKLQLFGFDLPYFTNLLLMSGYEYHNDYMKRNNYEPEQIKAQKFRLNKILHTGDKIKGITTIQLFWGTNFVNGEIIEVGRLQYQNQTTKISIHIPSGEPLKYEYVKSSLDVSREKVKRYFGIENVPFCCSSWLLSPELDNVLPEKSNIRDFRTLFDIREGKENLSSVLSSVFHTSVPEDFKTLSENTTLQKNIKEYLINGGGFHNGVGTLNYFEN